MSEMDDQKTRETVYGLVTFDPQAGSDGNGEFDWADWYGDLAPMEADALSWDRVTGADSHRVYCMGVAPYPGRDIELTGKDLAAAIEWKDRQQRAPKADPARLSNCRITFDPPSIDLTKRAIETAEDAFARGVAYGANEALGKR